LFVKVLLVSVTAPFPELWIAPPPIVATFKEKALPLTLNATVSLPL
jgi:hypothetical protein